MLPQVESCTLPDAEQPPRAAEFESLFSASLVSLDLLAPTRLSILLAGSGGLLERVRDLTDREAACCSFFTFTVLPADEGGVRLVVEVPPEHCEVLAAVAAHAQEHAGRG